MDYLKIYESIIKNAKLENRKRHQGIYYENHHILPKCLNGTDDEDNLVLLTGKEHFICHKILTVLYPNNRKIALAFHKMAFSGRDYGITCRDYERARQLISEIPVSLEQREKIGKRTRGKSYEELYGEKAEEQKEKRRQALLGKKHTKERRKKNSESHKGNIPWNRGLTKETDERVAQYVNSKPKSPYKKYILTTPENKEYIFLDKSELILFFEEHNNQYKYGSNFRINVLNLIKGGERKGYKIIKIKRNNGN